MRLSRLASPSSSILPGAGPHVGSLLGLLLLPTQDSDWRVLGLLILLCFNTEGYASLTMLEFSLVKEQVAWG